MILLSALTPSTASQDVTVTGRVSPYGGASGSSNISAVVWLSPASPDPTALTPLHTTLRQRNKAFEPHLLAIPKGSTVDFPNLDPWFHNVFSLFNGKKFDLGLYEAGTTRTVHFDREGISYIFCNIHPEMSAVVVVVASPYYAVAGKTGDFSIAAVPPGRYTLHLWSENSLPETLAGMSRAVEVSGSTFSLGTLRVREAETARAQHKNKYGQEYEPPSPNNPVYTQQ